MISTLQVFWDLFNNQLFGTVVISGCFAFLAFLILLAHTNSNDFVAPLIILLPLGFILKDYIGILWTVLVLVIGYVAGYMIIKLMGQSFG